jgi:hypothetical protein
MMMMMKICDVSLNVSADEIDLFSPHIDWCRGICT